MVEGENVHGSPFTWKVKPKVHYSKLLSVAASGPKQHEVHTEKHCWKIKAHLFPGAKKQKFEIGVTCVVMRSTDWGFSDVEVKRSSWCYQFGRVDRVQFSRSDNPYRATINSLHNGDVFSVFLDFDTKKLVIYNTRSKKSEVFTDAVGRDKVVPLISPYIVVDSVQNLSGLSLDSE